MAGLAEFAWPPGWEWQAPYDEPFERLVDDRGMVVATIDWMSSPPEYCVMGSTHLYVGEGWERQQDGNVAVVDMSGVKGAIALELGLEPPRQALSDALNEATTSARANGSAMRPSRNREDHRR